jgi:predicted molibdopterin-dependent oxidoreductase YjgC
VNEERLLQPHVREGEELVPVSWEEALSLVAKKINEILANHGSSALGGISSSHCANEAHYLFHKLMKEVIGTENLDLIKGRIGYEDDFLIRADKSPNSQGALDMGIHPGTEGLNASQMLAAGGGLKGLYIMGGRADLAEVFESEQLKEALSQMELVVLQVSNLTEACRYAHVLLPGATFAEVEGTFTNYASRVQRFKPVFDPRGESLPDWAILKNIAVALEALWPYECAEDVLQEAAAVISKYNGLTYPTIGDMGVNLGVKASE